MHEAAGGRGSRAHHTRVQLAALADTGEHTERLPAAAAGDYGKGSVLGQRLEALRGLGCLAVVIDAVAEPHDAG